MPLKESITGQRAQEREGGLPQQQQVVSIRVSEELRLKLEMLRQLISLKNAETITTSEAARQLLESAQGNRLELANLLTKPTENLVALRHKAHRAILPSAAEWALIAWYCWMGAETYADTARTKISNESIIGILQAFLAVYDLRKAKKTREDGWYLSNLPPQDREGTSDLHEAGKDEVRRAVNQTIKALGKPQPRQPRPIQAVQNLYHVLDELEAPNRVKLNRALWPYWPILWRVAARGHYFRHGKPLFFPRLIDHRVPPPPLPGFEEGECALSLSRLPSDTFSLYLRLPGRLAPLFPISEYPAIAEFRTLFDEFVPDQEDSVWRGYYFSAYATKAEAGDLMVCFRSEATGITFTLSQGDWSAIRNMTGRAWEKSEVRRLWDQWQHDYGEM
ncbi:MAG: hypothetical protein ACLQG3_10230 [Terracidiphilus sp.]